MPFYKIKFKNMKLNGPQYNECGIKGKSWLQYSPLFTLTPAHLYLPPDLVIILVLQLIFPTLDSHSNSFVFTAWPNEFTSLTFNLPHTLLSL
jgi:hypothetical protein